MVSRLTPKASGIPSYEIYEKPYMQILSSSILKPEKSHPESPSYLP